MHFSSIFSSIQLATVPGNTDLGYHLLRLNQNTQHISCRVRVILHIFGYSLNIICDGVKTATCDRVKKSAQKCVRNDQNGKEMTSIFM